MRRTEPTVKYLKGRKRCQKRGYDLGLLDEVVQILATRPFTEEEIIKYKDHRLKGNMKQYRELHLLNRHSDWVLIYQVIGNKVRFEDTYVVLENTGTHDECLGSEFIDDNEIIYV